MQEEPERNFTDVLEALLQRLGDLSKLRPDLERLMDAINAGTLDSPELQRLKARVEEAAKPELEELARRAADIPRGSGKGTFNFTGTATGHAPAVHRVHAQDDLRISDSVSVVLIRGEDSKAEPPTNLEIMGVASSVYAVIFTLLSSTQGEAAAVSLAATLAFVIAALMLDYARRMK